MREGVSLRPLLPSMIMKNLSSMMLHVKIVRYAGVPIDSNPHWMEEIFRAKTATGHTENRDEQGFQNPEEVVRNWNMNEIGTVPRTL